MVRLRSGKVSTEERKRVMKTCLVGFLIAVSIFVLSSCSNPTQGVGVSGGVNAGPFTIDLSIDSNGNVSVSGGFKPQVRVGLGPIGLQAGIQKTVELTTQRPYYLFILWEGANRQVQRDEYEIGQKFQLVFTGTEQVREIQGQSDSVIVVVQQQAASAPTAVFAQQPTHASMPAQLLSTPTSATPPTPVPDTAPGTILQVGETWSQGGLSLSLVSAEISGDGIYPKFIWANNTSNTVVTQVGERTFRLVTNNNIDLRLGGWSEGSESINPGEEKDYWYHYSGDLGNPSTTEIIAIANISRIANARWRIRVYH